MAILSVALSEARIKKISPHIKGDVLEIGCGHGQMRERFDGQISRYTGVDMCAESIEAAERAFPQDTFHLANIDDEKLPFTNEFDTVVLTAVIEHIFNLGVLGESIAQALRPGGRAVLTTPTPFGNDIVHRLGAAVGLFDRAAVDDHIVIFNRKRFEIFAGEFGLRLAEHRRFQLGCNQIAILEKP